MIRSKYIGYKDVEVVFNFYDLRGLVFAAVTRYGQKGNGVYAHIGECNYGINLSGGQVLVKGPGVMVLG